MLRWWHDAGVEVLVDEAPRAWLKSSPPLRPPAERHILAEMPVQTLPASLDALVDWVMTDPNLPEGGPVSRRVRPSGSLASGLMVLIDMPEVDDANSGTLLSGAFSALFEKMLSALGQDRSSIYLASMTPGRTPTGRIGADALERLGEIARAHVRLAAPRKLWVMGSAASRAILGMDDVSAHGSLHAINLDGCKVDAIATAHPRTLDSKERKARAWANMQLLIDKDHA